MSSSQQGMHCIALHCSKGQIFALFCVAVPFLASRCVVMQTLHCTFIVYTVYSCTVHWTREPFAYLYCIGTLCVAPVHCNALYVEPLAYYLSPYLLQPRVMSGQDSNLRTSEKLLNAISPHIINLPTSRNQFALNTLQPGN